MNEHWFHTFAIGLSLTGFVLCLLVWRCRYRILWGTDSSLSGVFQQEDRKQFILRNLMSGFIAVGTSILIAHNMILALWNGDNNFEQLNANPVAYLGPWDLEIYSSIQVHGWNHAWLLIQEYPSTLSILFLGLVGCLSPFGWRERFGLASWMVHFSWYSSHRGDCHRRLVLSDRTKFPAVDLSIATSVCESRSHDGCSNIIVHHHFLSCLFSIDEQS